MLENDKFAPRAQSSRTLSSYTHMKRTSKQSAAKNPKVLFDCPVQDCSSKFSTKSSKKRHLRTQHAQYYAENYPQHSSAFKEDQRRLKLADSQHKYYHGTVKIRNKEKSNYFKYAKTVLTKMMAEKAAEFFGHAIDKFYLEPSLLIPDQTTDQGNAALKLKYEQELVDRQVQIRFLKTMMEIELPKVLAKIKKEDLLVKVSDLAAKNEE